MPDASQSNALRRFRTAFPSTKRELMTLQLQQRRLDVSDALDIVFVVDTTGSMSSQLDDVAESLGDIAAGLASEFSSVKYAVIDFKDEDETYIVTGDDFVALAAAQSALDGLSASGGGDGPENGFGALWLAARMPWRDDTARAVILISDVGSHERGRTYQAAKLQLLNNDCVLFTGMDLNDPDTEDYAGYDSLVEATGGEKMEASTSAALTAQLVAALKRIGQPVSDPIFLVDDTTPFTADLENGASRTFENRSFEVNPVSSGEDGALSISLTIDNTDFAVSRYLAAARKVKLPLEVTLRLYFSNDNTGPQNDPPLVLFATDFETKGATVGCQLRWADLHNAPFPDAYYTPERCPALQ